MTWDSRRRTAWHRLRSGSSFAISFDRTFHVVRVRHMMCMRIPSLERMASALRGKTSWYKEK